MKNAWKLSWDIVAVIAGVILGLKVFLFSGSNIPTFGYFPIGIILGLLTLWIGAVVMHLIEGFLATIIYKIFGLRLENKLPLE